MIGARVGSYQITEKLGEGGMGAVYIAQHTLLGKKAAVKLLLPELSKNDEIVQRFFNEARAATMVHHKGIIEVFDFGYTDEGNAFIVMELLRGEALTDRIRARGKVPEGELFQIIRQAANALSGAHAANIVHRDLKPDNIFLCPDPEVVGGERVKVLDFGIAKLTADALAGAQKTRTGSVMGSPAYMSPEQCRGLSSVDARADIYSLGCVIYQMATGRLPFVGEGVGDIIGKHIYEQPPAPREINPSVSVALEDIILRCLSKEPAARFQTMDELVLAIDQASGGAYLRAQTGQQRATTANAVDATMMAGSQPPGTVTTLGGAAAEVSSPVPTGGRSKVPVFGAIAVAAAGAVVGAIMLGGGKGDKSEKAPQAASSAPAEAQPAAVRTTETKPKEVEKVFFVIETVPKGAEVYRMPAATMVGTTPFEDWKPAAEGKAVFMVKKAGFRDERVVIDADDGGSKKLTLVATTPAVEAKKDDKVATKSSTKRSKRRGRTTRKKAEKKIAKQDPPRTIASKKAPPKKKDPAKKTPPKKTGSGLWAD